MSANRHYVHDTIYDISSEIEYQHKGKERVGTIDEIYFEKDKYQKRLWYSVTDNETKETFKVDGDLYQTF